MATPFGCQNFLIAKYLINAITWIKCLRQAFPGDGGDATYQKAYKAPSTELICPTIHLKQSAARVKKGMLIAHTHTHTPAWLSVLMQKESLTAAGRGGGRFLQPRRSPRREVNQKRHAENKSGPALPIHLPCCSPNASSPPL